MKRKTIWGLSAAILAVLVIGGIVLSTRSNQSGIAVNTKKVSQEKIVEKLNLSGTVIPKDSENLIGSGTVTKVDVKVGDKVKKDQELAEYDNGLKLKAGQDGTVTEVNIKAGQPDASTQQNKAAIVVADLSELEVQLKLTNSEAKQVKVDQNAVITSGNQTFEGKVVQKDPTATASQATGEQATLGARVSLEKADDLYAGFTADVDITTASVDDAVALPIEALTYDKDNQAIVYTIKNGEAQAVKVETGIQSDTLVEIKDGLKVGDEVILSPSSEIKDGTAVTVE
ncbi:efflux RND transporter periplasmic adaptor subunit [Enterococcus mediterraneensis]|uniref:efflux RND transporter periplasmic adaptor subunit n=1 Tax=Enterococcus mediterraneensis TaxID=2364791 RepID=UPI000F06C3F3|nr:HlyD family efflux transporter periplasmic adaptor subunit [Enterococcus mediterraneensis]